MWSRIGIAVALTICALHLASGSAQEQPRSPPAVPAFKNLQLFPQDIALEELMAAMQMFEVGLGVDCDYCHATNGQPITMGLAGSLPGGFDFPSDDKPAKQISRRMLTMLQAINNMTPAAVGKAAEEAQRVECFNCHRGQTMPPLPLRNILDRTTAEKGLPAAIEQYRELRSANYGTAAYDFGDPAGGAAGVGGNGLLGYATQLFFRDRLEDAEAWLTVNLEYYPNSIDTLVTVAFMRLGKNDLAGAVERLDQAIALAPQNSQLKQLKEDWLKAAQVPPP